MTLASANTLSKGTTWLATEPSLRVSNTRQICTSATSPAAHGRIRRVWATGNSPMAHRTTARSRLTRPRTTRLRFMTANKSIECSSTLSSRRSRTNRRNRIWKMPAKGMHAHFSSTSRTTVLLRRWAHGRLPSDSRFHLLASTLQVPHLSTIFARGGPSTTSNASHLTLLRWQSLFTWLPFANSVTPSRANWTMSCFAQALALLTSTRLSAPSKRCSRATLRPS